MPLPIPGILGSVAGQALANWFRSQQKDPNLSGLGDFNDATPGGYDPTAYGRGGETVGAQNWSDYNVPVDIPSGINPNTGETVMLNPFYVPAQKDYQTTALENFWTFTNNDNFGSGITLVSDPFQMANYIGTAQTGGQTTGLMGAQGQTAQPVTPSGQPAGDVTVLPTMKVTDDRINIEDLGFGGNVFTPGAGLPPGQIETGPSGVSTYVPNVTPTATSAVTTTQTPGVTLTPNAGLVSGLVGPVSAEDLLNMTGGNVTTGTVNPALVIGNTPITETGPTMMPGMTVTGNRVDTGTMTGPTGGLTTVNVTPGSTGGQVIQEGGTLPTVNVTATNTGTSNATRFSGTDMLNELVSRQPTQLPPYTVSTSSTTQTNVNTAFNPNATISLTGLQNQPFVGPVPYTPPQTTTTSSTATSTATTGITGTTTNTGTTPGAGTTTSTLPSIGGGQGRNYRDFALELGETSAALQAKQQDLLNMYGGIYQNFLGQTSIPGAATSAASDLASSQQRLNNIRAGILSPEDLRNSQQAAREAYAARGQVMGTGAIGAEILNRENVRQQREAQAMQAYQNAMGNTLNVANLQTGNIFQPIGSLISGTFNPLSPYAADVYGTNVNAQLARDISNQNNAAAIQAAQFGANATRSAANTQLGANLIGNLIGGIFGGR
jgi:hypothetical protein